MKKASLALAVFTLTGVLSMPSALASEEFKLEERRQSCTSVSMMEVAPQLDNHLARSQPMGWCFAFSAADLLSIKLGKPVSAMALASSYYSKVPKLGAFEKFIRRLVGKPRDWREDFGDSVLTREGGSNSDVLNAALQDGSVCTEASVPSEFAVEDRDDKSNLAFKQESLAAAEEYVSALARLEDEQKFLKRLHRGQESVDDCETRERKDSVAKAANRLFPGVEFEDLVAIAARAPQAEFHDRVVKKACEKVELPKGWGVYEFDPERFHSEPRSQDAADLSILSLDFQLKKRNPVMVAISSDTLKDPSKGYRGKIQRDVDHAVLLVGREWMESEGKCYYQVKNSWSMHCKDYPNALCKKGVLWVSETDLRTMMGAVTFVK